MWNISATRFCLSVGFPFNWKTKPGLLDRRKKRRRQWMRTGNGTTETRTIQIGRRLFRRDFVAETIQRGTRDPLTYRLRHRFNLYPILLFSDSIIALHGADCGGGSWANMYANLHPFVCFVNWFVIHDHIYIHLPKHPFCRRSSLWRWSGLDRTFVSGLENGVGTRWNIPKCPGFLFSGRWML